MSGGVLSLTRSGQLRRFLPFTIDVVGSSFNWSAGDIVIQNAGSGGSGYFKYRFIVIYGCHIGTLQIGNALPRQAQNIE